MKNINDYLYYQDKDGLLEYAAKSEHFRSIVKTSLCNFKDELKEAGITVRKNSTKETLVNALLLYGLKTRAEQAKFTIGHMMEDILLNVETVDEFVKESFKIEKQIFIDAEVITDVKQEITRELIQENFHWEVDKIREKEGYLNLPVEIINKDEIISMRSGIKVLKENGYKRYAIGCSFIKEKEKKENLKDKNALEELEEDIYLVKEDFEARFVNEEKERYLYMNINIETGEKEYIYPSDILNKYKK